MYNLPQQLFVKNPIDRLTLKPVGESCNLEPLADMAAQVYFVDSLHRPVLSGGARAGGQADRKHQRCESRSRRNHVGAYRARDCGYQKVRWQDSQTPSRSLPLLSSRATSFLSMASSMDAADP